jgi:hypothetical protein
MNKSKHFGMEHLTVARDLAFSGRFSSVNLVPQYGMAEMGHVNPDLMGPSCLGINL